MKYPNFYNQVQTIQLYDPLSDFLGAVDDGIVEISYLDCVKLAGHSCPTVAGAYLMALKGVEALYDGELPQRGSIQVSMREGEGEGVTGVICNVISFVVGAAGIGGFKGIQGNFNRSCLISYNMPMQGEVKLTRLDDDKSVTLSYNPSITLPDPRMMPLMDRNLNGLASAEEKALFGTLWQERVEKILLSKESWDQMIKIYQGE